MSDVLTNSRINYYSDIRNYTKNELNYFNFLLNINELFRIDINPNLPLRDFNFEDNCLFLFKKAKTNKKVKINLFFYCLYGALSFISEIFPNPYLSKIQNAAKNIKNEFIFNISNGTTETNNQATRKINLNNFFEKLIQFFWPADPTIEFMINLFRNIYETEIISGNNMNFSNVNIIANLFLFFDSFVDFIDLIFDVKIISNRPFAGEITISQNKREITKELFEEFMSNAIKPMKLKFMSFSFINKVVEDVRSSYSNLLTLLSNNSSNRFNNDFKPALDYIFSTLNINELGDNFLSMIIDDNNIDKSVKNFEYVKTQLLREPDRRTRFFDSMYEFTTSHTQQRSMSILEEFFKKTNFIQNDSRFFNKKIVSIGLPTGFIKNIKTQNSKQNNTSVDSTLMRINLYKTDLRFPEIILKPKNYLFESSRYINETSPYLMSGGSIKPSMINMVKGSNVLLSDLFNPINHLPINHLYDKTFSEELHGFLSESEKQEIVDNHIIDHFLKIYLRIFNNGVRHFLDDNLSGLNISNSFFDRYMEDYVEEILKPLRVVNLSNSELEKLKFSLYNTFSNVSNKLYFRDYLYLPKRFDRIFNILVDPDDFDIDFETSKQLNFQNDESKLNRYLDNIENLRLDSRIDTSTFLKLPFISADDGDVVFDQYIFDIELL